MRFLNLGCGDQIADRWENADMRAREGVTKATLGYRLPWDDATFDGVVCHHVLDILDDADLSYGLSEIRRILTPGGVLRVSLIDPFVGFDALRLEDDEWLYSKVPDARVDDDRDRAFCRWLTWHGTRRQIWTARSFTADLRRRGWVDIRHTLYRSTMLVGLDTLDSRADESFFVEAIPSQLCDAE